jgi:hypothetical protein
MLYCQEPNCFSTRGQCECDGLPVCDHRFEAPLRFCLRLLSIFFQNEKNVFEFFKRLLPTSSKTQLTVNKRKKETKKERKKEKKKKKEKKMTGSGKLQQTYFKPESPTERKVAFQQNQK